MTVIEAVDELPSPQSVPETPIDPNIPAKANEDDEADVDDPDLLVKVTAEKLVGNTIFAKRQYEEAIQQYNKALNICPPLHPECAILHSNIAACHAKLENWQSCIDSATKALEITPTYEKAQSRRAVAGEHIASLGSLQMSLDGTSPIGFYL
jgi:tetratricopeptide (TPR) repeat protein